jgi:hypothetical protein
MAYKQSLFQNCFPRPPISKSKVWFICWGIQNRSWKVFVFAPCVVHLEVPTLAKPAICNTLKLHH